MRKVGRPHKIRMVRNLPKITKFSPRGKPGRPEEVELSLDQLEALRLADYEGLEQDAGAKIMRISRPSFGRILRQARHVIADGIVNGKIIRIQGGHVQQSGSPAKVPI